MITYAHSGSLGDLIYSLVVPKYFGKGDFYVKLRSMEYTTTKYNYHPEHIQDFHKRKMTDEDFKLLVPLLKSQPYINKVIATDDSAMQVDYDLDSFRGVMWRSFTGNYSAAYYKTFNIPYTAQDIITPWLVAEPKVIAPIVVARTFRYRNPASEQKWKQFVALDNFSEIAIFVGHEDKYEDFVKTFDTKLLHYKPKDFLELAQVIAGSQHVISNQTFVYSLAQGLGKSTSLETISDRTLENNECYFPRKDNYYF